MKRLLVLLALVALALPAQAELVLRQSTASQAVVIGPFVDSTDGNTAETALTIDAADVRISINGANIVGKTSGGCTHDELGYYTCTFDATDTATVGRMQVMVHETGALPVYHEFQVAEEAVYDACCAASAAPLTATDVWAAATRTLTALDEDGTTLDLNATAIGSVAGAVGSVTGAVGSVAAGGIANTSFAAGAIDAAAIAANALGASELAADAATEAATAVRDVVVEDQGSIGLGCALAAVLAVTAGDVATSGGNSTFEEASGTETRVTSVVVTAGNRTVTITCPTY